MGSSEAAQERSTTMASPRGPVSFRSARFAPLTTPRLGPRRRFMTDSATTVLQAQPSTNMGDSKLRSMVASLFYGSPMPAESVLAPLESSEPLADQRGSQVEMRSHESNSKDPLVPSRQTLHS